MFEDSDAVRDTPPQATDDDGGPIFFGCDPADAMFEPTQSCSSASGFPLGDTTMPMVQTTL
jgi:hypothetical protein